MNTKNKRSKEEHASEKNKIQEEIKEKKISLKEKKEANTKQKKEKQEETQQKIRIIHKKPITKRDPIITSDDILGKDAIDPQGGMLGIVVKLHISIQTKQITGITIDQGLMKPNLFVGIDYIKHFGIDTILLNEIPTDTIKGMTVFTEEGKTLGTVKEIRLKRSKIKSLRIKQTGFSFKQENIEIPASHIQEISSSVILKKQH